MYVLKYIKNKQNQAEKNNVESLIFILNNWSPL